MRASAASARTSLAEGRDTRGSLGRDSNLDFDRSTGGLSLSRNSGAISMHNRAGSSVNAANNAYTEQLLSASRLKAPGAGGAAMDSSEAEEVSELRAEVARLKIAMEDAGKKSK